MKHYGLLGALSLATLLLPVGALAQTVPVGQPPPGAYPAQVAPYPGAAYPAQGYPGGERDRGKYLRIVNSLPLSNAQRQQIDQDVAATHQADQGANRRTKREHRKQLHRAIDSILTPEQLAVVRSQMQASHGQRQQGRPNLAPVPGNVGPGPQNVVPVPRNVVPVPQNGVPVPTT
jgi:Spy/CpxP family protein refolding chaperone